MSPNHLNQGIGLGLSRHSQIPATYSGAIGSHRASLPGIERVFATKQKQRALSGREAFMSRVRTHSWAIVLAVAFIASAIAWSNLVGSAGAPAYLTKADFDQAFTDAAAWRSESKPAIRNGVGDSARSSGGAASVNRERKSDRLPVLGHADAAAPASTRTTVVRKNAASPEPASATPARQKTFETDDAMRAVKPKRAAHCEPIASPAADPALGRIIGRCFV
jgi:hypothetical protein